MKRAQSSPPGKHSTNADYAYVLGGGIEGRLEAEAAPVSVCHVRREPPRPSVAPATATSCRRPGTRPCAESRRASAPYWQRTVDIEGPALTRRVRPLGEAAGITGSARGAHVVAVELARGPSRVSPLLQVPDAGDIGLGGSQQPGEWFLRQPATRARRAGSEDVASSDFPRAAVPKAAARSNQRALVLQPASCERMRPS
jgi:hypothetical protein